MYRILTLVIVSQILVLSCPAQWFIEPVIGYQLDIHNRQDRFNTINSAVQFARKSRRHYELLFQLQRCWPMAKKSMDSSFTLLPNAPLYKPANKTIRPSGWSVSIGHRFILTSLKSTDAFSILLFTGVSHQQIAVEYNYDKPGYIILNPDKTQQRTGGFISGGIEYMRTLKSGRLFCQLLVATMPSGGRIPSYSSFDFFEPVIFNAGYSLLISKTTHGKK